MNKLISFIAVALLSASAAHATAYGDAIDALTSQCVTQAAIIIDGRLHGDTDDQIQSEIDVAAFQYDMNERGFRHWADMTQELMINIYAERDANQMRSAAAHVCADVQQYYFDFEHVSLPGSTILIGDQK